MKVYFFESLLQSHDPSEIILIFWFVAQIVFFLWIESSEEQHRADTDLNTEN